MFTLLNDPLKERAVVVEALDHWFDRWFGVKRFLAALGLPGITL